MQQDNKHTDKKLQELENQSLPDLSRMDGHWQQLKAMLQPTIVPASPKKKLPKKYFRWMIAAAFTGGGFFIAYSVINNSGNSKGIDSTYSQPPAVIEKMKPDTLPSIQFILRQKDTGKDSVVIFIPQKPKKQTPVLIFNPPPAKTKRDTLYFKPAPDESKPDRSIINEAATLNNFFKQLEKRPQRFVINNKRDTLITGEDGTALLVPAGTFNGSDEVVITMKEFYSYEDIIANKLTTTSNGQQLITGGMVHIIATINGKETDIEPGKSIRWFIPDTTKEMSRMQLFTGSANNMIGLSDREGDEKLPVFFNRSRDTTAATGIFEVMNWIPQERYFSDQYLVTSVKVLDLKDEPMKKRITKRGEIGVFLMSENPKISKEDLAAELKEKYGYHKVKIKSRLKPTFIAKLMPGFTRWRRLSSSDAVGDSTWVSNDIAKRYRLKITDSVTYLRTRMGYSPGYYAKRTFSDINMNSLANRFSVDIRTLGWINCDRFNNEGPKIDFFVDLKDTANKYYTLLVFDKIRSMIQGYSNGNKVIFSNVPAGRKAKVISIGVQNGKTVSAMETVQLSKIVLTGLKFEETSPAAFKEDVKGFDK